MARQVEDRAVQRENQKRSGGHAQLTEMDLTASPAAPDNEWRKKLQAADAHIEKLKSKNINK